MDHSCTVYKTMEYLARKWTIMILMELNKGKSRWKRFSSLRDSMKDITPKVLSERLKELVEVGLIEKRVDASSFPVKSEYALTESGSELMDAVRSVKDWALKWKVKNNACASQDCRVCTL